MTRKLILFLFLTLHVTGSAQNWDIDGLKAINKIDNSLLKDYSHFASNSMAYISIGIPLGMASYAYFTHKKGLLKDAIYIGTSVIEAGTLTYGMKLLSDRQRPFERYSTVIQRNDATSSSFPSGHAAAAFALATSLSIRYPKWYVIAPSFLWAGSVGFARMHEGVHYPSDVIAGAAIGSGCALINCYVNRALNKLLFDQ